MSLYRLRSHKIYRLDLTLVIWHLTFDIWIDLLMMSKSHIHFFISKGFLQLQTSSSVMFHTDRILFSRCKNCIHHIHHNIRNMASKRHHFRSYKIRIKVYSTLAIFLIEVYTRLSSVEFIANLSTYPEGLRHDRRTYSSLSHCTVSHKKRNVKKNLNTRMAVTKKG